MLGCEVRSSSAMRIPSSVSLGGMRMSVTTTCGWVWSIVARSMAASAHVATSSMSSERSRTLLILQALGGWYVDTTIRRATDTYGLFATVIGLLSWLTLAPPLALIAADVNAFRSPGLWPRSLSATMTAADRKALERYARSALHDPRE